MGFQKKFHKQCFNKNFISFQSFGVCCLAIGFYTFSRTFSVTYEEALQIELQCGLGRWKARQHRKLRSGSVIDLVRSCLNMSVRFATSTMVLGEKVHQVLNVSTPNNYSIRCNQNIQALIPDGLAWIWAATVLK